MSEDDEKTDDVLQAVKRRRREKLLREKGLGISLDDLDIYDVSGLSIHFLRTISAEGSYANRKLEAAHWVRERHALC